MKKSFWQGIPFSSGDSLALICGFLMLGAFLFLPWFSFHNLEPLNNPVLALEGRDFTGLDLLEQPTTNPSEIFLSSRLSTLFLVPVAALGIITFALTGLFDRRWRNIARKGELAAGLLALAHFAVFFLMQAGQDLNDFIGSAFLLVLIAAAATIAQALWVARRESGEQKPIPGHLVAGACAVLLLVSFLFLPWGKTTAGAESFTALSLSGDSSPEQADFAGGSIIFVAMAAIGGVALSGWGSVVWRSGHIAAQLTVLAGLLGMIYFARVLYSYNFFEFEGWLGIGFWLALLAGLGLMLQIGLGRREAENMHKVRLLRLPYFWQEQLNAYLFLLPAIILFAIFAWYPILRSILMSFEDVNLAGDSKWVGLDNFNTMIKDPGFSDAWRNSFEFAGLSVVIGFFVPVLVAILVNEMRLAKGFFRLVYFLPAVIPAVISLLVWQELYLVGRFVENQGYFNRLLIELGFEPQFWLSDPELVKPSMLIIMTWGGFGSTMLLYLAALQDLPVELYEAAEIDGASMIDRIRYITFSHLRPTMLVLLILQIIGVVQIFLEPFVLTKGGPGRETTTPVLKIYQKAFDNYQFGVAAAWSVMLIVVLALFSLVYLRYSKLMEER